MARRQYISPTPGEFPLIASTPWNARATAFPTIKDFIKVKETGFNAGLLSTAGSQMANIRFAAKVADLKLIVSIGDIRMSKEDMIAAVQTATGSKVDKDSERFNDAPDSDMITAWSFSGYPTESELGDLSKSESTYDTLYNWDVARNIHVNLIGEDDYDIIGKEKTYQHYLDKFCEKFGPMVLSYNHYPFNVNPEGVANDSFSQFYEDLMIYSRKYRDSGIPFWNYVQCAYVKRASNGSILYSEATEWTLRFQIFNSLAFCVQGLIFWTYGRRPSDTNDNFVSALLNDSGNLTEAGEAVKRINKEVCCLSDIFLGAVPQDYYRTGATTYNDPNNPGNKVPLLRESNELPYYVGTRGRRGAFVTTFDSMDKKVPSKLRHYLMVVSQNIENSLSVTVKFNSVLKFGIGIKAYSILPNLDSENGGYIRSEIQTGARLEFSLPRSGYLLFEYETV